MKEKFIKKLGLIISCLTLCLLLSVTAQVNNSKVSASNIHTDELAPWG